MLVTKLRNDNDKDDDDDDTGKEQYDDDIVHYNNEYDMIVTNEMYRKGLNSMQEWACNKNKMNRREQCASKQNDDDDDDEGKE